MMKACKYRASASVCCYANIQLRKSKRGMARLLRIHHTTWLRYLKGERYPTRVVKHRLVHLMKAEDFLELVTLATEAGCYRYVSGDRQWPNPHLRRAAQHGGIGNEHRR